MPQGTEAETPKSPADLVARLQSVATRSRAVVQEFLTNSPDLAHLGMGDAANIGQAFVQLATKAMADPWSMARAQIEFWQQAFDLWAQAMLRLLGADEPTSPSADKPTSPSADKRFKHPQWTENAVFAYIRDSYLLSARAVLSAERGVKGLDPETARKVDFYTRQFIDAMSPSNFMATNPEVLERTVQTGGENLLDGLSNLLRDLQRGKGKLNISMTSMEAFRLGDNIAGTPGKVVFQTEMMQLIQYTPTTETVRKTPLLIVPPWINKFYVLDLQPKNSFIRWCVEQGHTVFVISWINPDASLRHKGFENYMLEGTIAALDAIETATGEREANCIGYCLGGTLLASTLGYLTALGEERVRSATYFVTLVDFSESGDMSVFIDKEQLAALDARMQETGFLEARDMATSFNMLRSNDLIWSFVVGNYLLGREPVPFDLLYWNADATRMPSAMHSFYLHNMYEENNLVKPGRITLNGQPIDLRQVKTPSFVLGTKEDHIAPWKGAYRATQVYAGEIEFVLSASGHMAGVISPPGGKYGHWRNDARPPDADAWLAGATEHKSSWWPHWDAWVMRFSGGEVPARQPGEGALPALEDAPGSYVLVRADA